MRGSSNRRGEPSTNTRRPHRSGDGGTREVGSKWKWHEDKPGQVAVSADIIRIFKAEGVDQPGVLARGAPSDQAMLFAREAIQNTWDAARELRSDPDAGPQPPFQLDLRFHRLVGERKRRLVQSLGISDHDARLGDDDRAKRRRRVGLTASDCLDELDDDDRPLHVLIYSERAALGMEGAWDRSESRMMYALNRVGYTMKRHGAGGSFGYGKAGLIAASRVHIIVAYSCFAPSPDAGDPATRRLLGVTYWSQHEFAGSKFTGWSHLGAAEASGDIRPFEDDDADAVAASLGLDVRRCDVPLDRGTTFMIIEPSIDAEEMRTAIERNWWPAIRSTSEPLRIAITDYDGTRMVPQVPVDDPDLGPFVRAFDLATRPPDGTAPTEYAGDLGTYSPHGRRTLTLGRVGLVADDKGWSFPDGSDDADAVEHCTMVALVRGPRMIVEYHRFNLGMPFVRGCFVADPFIDDLLRQTEPAAHDKWSDSVGPEGIDPVAPNVAREVINRLRVEVKKFKSRFAQPPPRAGELNLPVLDELSRLMKGKKPPAPQQSPRTVSLNFVTAAHAVEAGPSHLQCRSAVEVRVEDWVWDAVGDSPDVEVTAIMSVAFVEDEAIGERVDLRVATRGAAFVQTSAVDGRYEWRGRLGPADSVTFEVETVPYFADWSVKFSPTAEVTDPTPRPADRRGAD